MISSRKEVVRRDVCLFQYSPQCTFRHVSGMVRDGCVAVGLWVVPNLMTTCCLPMERKAKLTQTSRDFTVLETSQSHHIRMRRSMDSRTIRRPVQDESCQRSRIVLQAVSYRRLWQSQVLQLPFCPGQQVLVHHPKLQDINLQEVFRCGF